MRTIIFAITLTSLFMAVPATVAQEKNKLGYHSVGDDFNPENVLSEAQMTRHFNGMKQGDTLTVSFVADVKSVCKNKGCWMKLGLGEDSEVMVKFKDYAFFVPMDIDGSRVIVNGRAYVTEVSVEEQRHLAEDEGKTSEEVAAIVNPKRTWSFMADGVKIKN